MGSVRLWSWHSGAILGLTGAAALAALFGLRKPLFLPAKSSAGHHQIEVACDGCHTPFKGVTNDACNACHGAELQAVKDSHGLSKFRDPRTADMLSTIDATRCVTCHREHVPHLTQTMSVTAPADFCQLCHGDIATERPSHSSFPPDGCASTGCHRYHDNTALYEDFLVLHLDEPDLKSPAHRRPRNLGEFFAAVDPARKRPLGAAEHDAKARRPDPKIVSEWEHSSHARGGVGCRDCHEARGQSWTDHPGLAACQRCHAPETRGFLAGRHGMRLERGLPPMTPAQAVLPMKAAAADRELGCSSCHGSHSFDTRRAAVEACRSCHDDEHSRNYTGSPHHLAWQKELRGEAEPGSGVSCATCHLPRLPFNERARPRTLVEHNQNANLRPDDKFVRSVCIDCHGVFFASRALADDANVRRNFRGPPATKLDTFEMVRRRVQAQTLKR